MNKGFLGRSLFEVLIVIFFVIFPSVGFAALWTTEVVDPSTLFSDFYPRAIAIDKNDLPHIAYGKVRLYYVYFNGTDWKYEVVDESPTTVGERASIALDSKGKVHICYYDSGLRSLKYATNTSGSWDISTIQSGAGWGSAIAIDKNDKVHIAYYATGKKDLEYATNTSGSWSITTIDDAGDVGNEPVIALDSNNNVHIAYGDSSDLNNHKLKYATNASGSWVVNAPIDDYYGGSSFAMAVSKDIVHISYCYGTFTKKYLKYATKDIITNSWDIIILDDSNDEVGYNSSITIDTFNNVYIAYSIYGYPTKSIVYATKDINTGSWKRYQVDDKGIIGDYSIATDSKKNVHIIYSTVNSNQESTGHEVKYAFYDSTAASLNISIIDMERFVGWDTSIDVDSGGKVHISYRDYYNRDLLYATNATGSWVITNIESAGSTGHHTSIAIDSVGKAHISYYDLTNGALKYATNASGSWLTYFIESVSVDSTSIAVDSSNNVHICYRDSTNSMLKYVTNASGPWVISSVDKTNTGYVSLAIGLGNKVHISYRGEGFTKGPLKYATNATDSWESFTIDDGIDGFGIWTSIAIDSTGKVHIAYDNNSYISIGDTFILKYATNVTGSWVKSIIDDNGMLQGQYPSIGIDSNNKVHISYKDNTGSTSYIQNKKGRSLKYATNLSDSWQIYYVDTVGIVGDFSSIAIDSKDNVHISYHDKTRGDLKYATNTPTDCVQNTYYRDSDNDTYGDASTSAQACTQPSGYVTNSTDCNDSNTSINPGATETCNNSIDDNCNTQVDEGCPVAEVCDGIDNDNDGQTDEGVKNTYYRDSDNDTYGDVSSSTQACTQPSGYVVNSSDCNDGNASINTGATEVCNSIDDNCNNQVDEGCPGVEICDGIDNDNDGQTDEGVKNTYYRDSDNDTYGDASTSAQACTQPSGYVTNSTDCNDSNTSINPGATETCNNSIDDNCNTQVDEGCPVAEVCDGIDNDNDGQVDEGVKNTYYRDSDNDTYGDASASAQSCTQPSGYVANSSDCNDGNASINTGATEVCNSIDDNCNNQVDEGCPGVEICDGIDNDNDGQTDEGVKNTYYRDSDNDTYGDASASAQSCTQPSGYVANSIDCNDGNASINTGATESCNSIDDNCNNQVDEGCPGVEICDGIDNDNDGQIDEGCDVAENSIGNNNLSGNESSSESISGSESGSDNESGSESESGSGSGGCFIATAAYGSYFHPHVQILRLFRDEILIRSALGRMFVMTYYRISPYAADWIQERGWAKGIIRLMLGPIVLWAWLTVNTSLWVQIFIYGSAVLFIISFIGRRCLWRRGYKGADF